MNSQTGSPVAENEILKLRVEYLQKRLEQTLQHSQTATKLIYLVDGAVLGFCYFFIKEFGKNPISIGIAAFSVFVLAILNYLHSGLIGNQQSWYNGIDEQIRNLLSLEKISHSTNSLPLCPKSSHKIWQRIHLFLFGSLIIVTVVLILWFLKRIYC
jgi:hypothetical protein